MRRSEPVLADFYADKAVLVTGGLGFIGSNLAARLCEYGARVTLVDSLIPEYGGNLFNVEPLRGRVTINISDVRDRSSMNYLVQRQDLIFNLAGTLSHTDSMRDPSTDLMINCVSQLTILEACRAHNPGVKILFPGTRGQYGRAKTLPVTEEHPLHPVDVNGINKLAGEMYHILYSEIYGIRAVSLRLCNTYGPRHQMRHHRQGVLNWFIRQLIDGTTVRIYGDGEQIRDCNYVSDVVEACLLAMATDGTDGQVYNLGGTPVSLRAFVEKAMEILGSGSYELVEFPPDLKPIEVGDYIADYSKFSRATGWRPEVSLEEGIRRTIDFFKTHRERYW